MAAVAQLRRRRRRSTLAAVIYPSLLLFVFSLYVLNSDRENSVNSYNAGDKGLKIRQLLAEKDTPNDNKDKPQDNNEKSDDDGGDEVSPPKSSGKNPHDPDDQPSDSGTQVKETPPAAKSKVKAKPNKNGAKEELKASSTLPPPKSSDSSNESEDTNIESPSATSQNENQSTSTQCPESTTETVDDNVLGNRRRVVHKPLWTEDEVLCQPPAYREFPTDLFTNKQRAGGAVIIHILVCTYMFYALAVVCDSYFVNALETICEKIGLSEDVAGATFMAAGSSAPELFASLLGVFVAKGDVGTGTIVGSAVFNVLFVIGACALLTDQPVPLTWWPLLRDSSFYAFTVLILIAVMADGAVAWWEAVLMLCLYGIYILIMKFNHRIKSWLVDSTPLKSMDEMTEASRGILESDMTGKVHSSYVQFNNDLANDYSDLQSKAPPPLDVCLRDRRRFTLVEAFLLMMTTHHFRPKTRFWAAAKRIIYEYRRQQQEGPPMMNQNQIDFDIDNYPKKDIPGGNDSGPSDEWKNIPTQADGLISLITWAMTVPVQAALYYTIPNCRKPRWERWFLATFLVSMLWIAFFSYILVWMVVLIGYTCGIPDNIMGITFLAAGSSVPDAISSLLVAKQGQGDMAVSNSIGSNVFDILVGLALPWFLQTTIVMPGTKIYINSRGMVYNVLLLFLSIGITILAVHKNNWQLNTRLGIILMVTYVAFLIFAILIEYNIFGFVNPPECE